MQFAGDLGSLIWKLGRIAKSRPIKLKAAHARRICGTWRVDLFRSRDTYNLPAGLKCLFAWLSDWLVCFQFSEALLGRRLTKRCECFWEESTTGIRCPPAFD